MKSASPAAALPALREEEARIAAATRQRDRRNRRWRERELIERDGNAAVGSVVTYEVAGKTVRRQVQRTYSYCAANGPDVHVGPGDQPGLDRVRVVWTDGVAQEFGPVEAGERAVLRRD